MTQTEIPTVDTSADTIAALLHDLYHSDMACALTHQAAQVIEALRADLGPIKGLTDEDHANIIAHLSPELEPRGPLPNANSLMMAIVHLRNEIAPLTAERDAALAGAVKVRPLVWEDHQGRGAKAAAFGRCNYLIAQRHDGTFEACESYPGYGGPWIGGVFYPTLEAAKTAAQADYEARIIAAIQPDTDSLQKRANDWVLACFGAESLMDKTERTHRFLEEALELAQACDCTKGEALQLVDYVFARDKGDVAREVGDVLNTIAMLCTAHDIDMDDAGHKGLDRCWENIEKTRAKRAAKPSFSPLPVEVQPDTEAVEMAEAAAFSAGFEAGERAEREACAMVADKRGWPGTMSAEQYSALSPTLDAEMDCGSAIAAAIRKRGEG